MERDLFLIATRKKYRFVFRSGLVTIEELWDIPMSRLDDIYKVLSKQKKELEEDSLFERNVKDQELLDKIEIVKTIFTIRKEEQEVKKRELAEKEALLRRKEYIEEVLLEKEYKEIKKKDKKELHSELEEIQKRLSE